MIKTLLCSTAVVAMTLTAAFAQETPEKDAAKRPAAAAKPIEWKLGLQAWTYNRFTLFETIDKARSMGIPFLEAYPGQPLSPENKDTRFDVGASAEVRAQVKEKLKKAGVKLVNFGVVDVGGDEASARKVFEFAKDMGIETIVAEPKAELMKTLDKLAEEYKINLAIHNHPEPSPYWNPDTVLKAVEGCGKRVGACADTGHWVRSGLNPVECLKKLDGRVISLHFKDLNEKKPGAHDVPWGTGISDVPAMLAELKRQGFSGVFSVEYEYHEENPTPEVTQCVEAFKKLCGTLKVKLAAPARRPGAVSG